MKGRPLQATVLSASPAQPASNGWGALAGHTLCSCLFSFVLKVSVPQCSLFWRHCVQKSGFRGLILGSGDLILDSQPLPFSYRAAPGLHAMRPLVAGGGIPVKFSGGSHYMLIPNKILAESSEVGQGNGWNVLLKFLFLSEERKSLALPLTTNFSE